MSGTNNFCCKELSVHVFKLQYLITQNQLTTFEMVALHVKLVPKKKSYRITGRNVNMALRLNWLIKSPLNVSYHPLISCFELTLTPLFSSSSTTSISPTQDASLRLSSSILFRSIPRIANLWHITYSLLCNTHYPHRLTIHMNWSPCKISV